MRKGSNLRTQHGLKADEVDREMRAPKILNDIVDKVLAYRPKPKSKAAKRRQRRAKAIGK
jgi:hypothetical protein